MTPSRRQSRLALLALMLAVVLPCADVARADVGETIIQRCTHQQPLGGFSPSAYGKALKELSADTEEYTNCAALIRRAQLAAAGGAGGTAGASGERSAPIPASPAEQRAVAHAAQSGAAPQKVGGEVVQPGVVHADAASAFSALPSPLLAIVAFLLACLAVLAGGSFRKRFRGERPD
jgi:hypothetical protein